MDDSNQERMSDVSNNTMEHTPITTESAPNTKDEITIIDRLGNVGVVSVKARRQIAARCQAASARRQVTAMATGGKKSDVSRKRTEPHIFQKIVHVPILFWLRAHLWLKARSLVVAMVMHWVKGSLDEELIGSVDGARWRTRRLDRQRTWWITWRRTWWSKRRSKWSSYTPFTTYEIVVLNLGTLFGMNDTFTGEMPLWKKYSICFSTRKSLGIPKLSAYLKHNRETSGSLRLSESFEMIFGSNRAV